MSYVIAIWSILVRVLVHRDSETATVTFSELHHKASLYVTLLVSQKQVSLADKPVQLIAGHDIIGKIIRACIIATVTLFGVRRV
jgi:hypothetical protein